MNKTPRINPIETLYNGIRFRSRLEARWAVFFDALKMRWEYEPEAYALPSGNYLPDFRITDGAPSGDCWVEVKPLGAEFDTRWRELKNLSGLDFVVCRNFDLDGVATVLETPEPAKGQGAGECEAHWCVFQGVPRVWLGDEWGPDTHGHEQVAAAFAYAKGYRFWG